MEPTKFTQLPVYKKALEIFQMSRGIAYAVSEKPHVLEMGYSSRPHENIAGTLVTTSLNLFPELAAIQNATSRENLLKRARNIRRSARVLLSKSKIMEKQGLKEEEFLKLLRKEVNNFDTLFSEWLNTLNSDKNRN